MGNAAAGSGGSPRSRGPDGCGVEECFHLLSIDSAKEADAAAPALF